MENNIHKFSFFLKNYEFFKKDPKNKFILEATNITIDLLNQKFIDKDIQKLYYFYILFFERKVKETDDYLFLIEIEYDDTYSCENNNETKSLLENDYKSSKIIGVKIYKNLNEIKQFDKKYNDIVNIILIKKDKYNVIIKQKLKKELEYCKINGINYYRTNAEKIKKLIENETNQIKENESKYFEILLKQKMKKFIKFLELIIKKISVYRLVTFNYNLKKMELVYKNNCLLWNDEIFNILFIKMKNVPKEIEKEMKNKNNFDNFFNHLKLLFLNNAKSMAIYNELYGSKKEYKEIEIIFKSFLTLIDYDKPLESEINISEEWTINLISNFYDLLTHFSTLIFLKNKTQLQQNIKKSYISTCQKHGKILRIDKLTKLITENVSYDSMDTKFLFYLIYNSLDPNFIDAEIYIQDEKVIAKNLSVANNKLKKLNMINDIVYEIIIMKQH